VKIALDELIRQAPGVAHAIVATADGLVLAASDALVAARADQLATLTCGLISLATGGSDLMAWGQVEMCRVDMEAGLLIVIRISDGSNLAALVAGRTGEDRRPTDIGQVAYEMSRLVTRLGDILTPQLRAQLTNAAAMSMTLTKAAL